MDPSVRQTRPPCPDPHCLEDKWLVYVPDAQGYVSRHVHPDGTPGVPPRDLPTLMAPVGGQPMPRASALRLVDICATEGLTASAIHRARAVELWRDEVFPEPSWYLGEDGSRVTTYFAAQPSQGFNPPDKWMAPTLPAVWLLMLSRTPGEFALAASPYLSGTLDLEDALENNFDEPLPTVTGPMGALRLDINEVTLLRSRLATVFPQSMPVLAEDAVGAWKQRQRSAAVDLTTPTIRETC